MSVGIFSDRARPPEPAAMLAAVGPAADLWEEAVSLLEVRHGAKGDLRFYGRNYGWALRFRRKGRALASLYPSQGHFTVQVIVPPAAEADLRGRLRAATRDRLDAATAFKEGRWLFLPVASREDLAELELLLDARLALNPSLP